MGYVIPIRLEKAIDCDLDIGALYLTAEQVTAACDYLHTISNSTIKQMYNDYFHVCLNLENSTRKQHKN